MAGARESKMRQPRRRCLVVALVVSALAAAIASPGEPHVKKPAGPFVLTIGWADEPVYSGSKNAVEVVVADRSGTSVTDLGGSLTVEVSYGSERILLPLLPSDEQPGELQAALVPTRPGTYGFHIAGSVKGQPIDIQVMCSDRTFDCVTDSSAVEFPANDPSNGQLAERLARALPRAEGARDTAATARYLAIGALAVAIVALGAAIGFGVRRRGSA